MLKFKASSEEPTEKKFAVENFPSGVIGYTMGKLIQGCKFRACKIIGKAVGK